MAFVRKTGTTEIIMSNSKLKVQYHTFSHMQDSQKSVSHDTNFSRT